MSFMFEVDNVKSERILRDFFNFRSWQEQKRSNSGRLPSNMDSWVQSWRPRTNAFCVFLLHLPKVLRLPWIWCQVIRSAAPFTQNNLSKPEDLMPQNATPLRKSAPWPPNISDEHVSCTAPATRNSSLQILFNAPRLPTLLKVLQTPRFAHFWQGAPRKTTSDIQKLRGHVVFCTFWLRHVLRATTLCTFSTSQLPKSAPGMLCFVHFDFDKCFVPQRRAIFHLSFGQMAPHLPL